MSAFTVISGVTKTLSTILNTGTGLTVINDLAPDEAIGDDKSQIHLYLYRVELNHFFRNADWMSTSTSGIQSPPVGVNLHYLVVPHGKGQLDIQKTLGQIVQVLNDNAVVPPTAYDTLLSDTTEELRVVPHPLTLEAMTELWRAFESRSYRLSLTYAVSVALIDSTITRTVSRVEERRVLVSELR